MDSLSKQELISTITKQADQIKRYETRLRDVVTAYKGLSKEKEALEASLKVLHKAENVSLEGPSSKTSDDSVAALTLTLSTLTEEKSRMEEAFQADKKVTRDKYENMIAAMREETKNLIQQHQIEVNNLKAKIAYEIQEREKDTADHTAIMKELQTKLNIEMKSNMKLEDKVVTTSEAQVSTAELEKRVRDLSSELAAARRRLARGEARAAETPAALRRLQEKLALLENSRALAVTEEQIKAKRAEESARKVIARQEERVAELEEKLAELSQTVGEYDARRRRDQNTIEQLRETLNAALLEKMAVREKGLEQSSQKSETDSEKLADTEYLHNLIDKIHILKKELLSENEKLGSPIDVSTIFHIEGSENVHQKCKEELEKLLDEYQSYKIQNVKKSGSEMDSEVRVRKLSEEILELKDRLENHKFLLEDERREKKEMAKMWEEKLKSEAEYHKEVTSDLKTRIQALEKQVQTQRDRYAALLEETDSFIKSRSDRSRKVSTEEGNAVFAEGSAPSHVLHYASELARRELEVASLRRTRRALQAALRDSQRESTIEKERFKEVIRTLKEEIERLRRIQSREGANLEYLKNVVMAYLMSTDDAGRKHMLNAIAAVLHFTKAEKNAVLATL